MLKVHGFALYGPLAASNRYRLGQYHSGLKYHGIDLHLSCILDDEYLKLTFAKRKPNYLSMFRAGIARCKVLLNAGDYDIAIIYSELFPLLPYFAESCLITKPYVYDMDDAFFLKYRSGRLGKLHGLLGDKIDGLIGGASAVTAGNQYLLQYATRFCGNCHYLPTVVDTARYQKRAHAADFADVFTVGWIGSPTTAVFLHALVEPLQVLGRDGAVRFVVIGGPAPKMENVEVVEVAWDEDTEIDWINTFDVGVMPLHDSEWARGKCAFKLIQYMACEVPVVASRVGANLEVVGDDCGILVDDAEDWLVAFRALRNQTELRAAIGRAGRQRVEEHYSLQSQLPVLADIIHGVAAARA